MANLYAGGVDKFSYEGRIAFTENHLDDIFDSADRPLEGRRWCLVAGDPFQCLATCINLIEALRRSSPKTTISYMPVHQLGAAAINLVAGEKPADVYLGIASRVLDIMRRNAEKDPATDLNASCARLLINQVDRKLVKQTVMKSVYGMICIGARDQIKKRLKDRCAIEDENELFAASCYAAKTTLTALGEMFEATQSIMSWLGDCAEHRLIQWTRPLNLRLTQLHLRTKKQVLGAAHSTRSLSLYTSKLVSTLTANQKEKVSTPPSLVSTPKCSEQIQNKGRPFPAMVSTLMANKREGVDTTKTENLVKRRKFLNLLGFSLLELGIFSEDIRVLISFHA
ncbi:hypothetical protein LOK49_LG11G01562 [Camellia lanceoleosa]|uniref:Uncharacterized protein n=1 Tax=Camellia lanceoleosa TaxID=1840588 RepID=A0ACC0G0Q5_9ERIC|nr:hypothetical protein LOK49_LG11G01562 [Camellia lanceoleosa]